MTDWIKNNKFLAALIVLSIILLTNLQFLPTFGGHGLYALSNLTYSALSLISLMLVFLVPIGLIALLILLIKDKRVSPKAVIIVLIGVFGYVNGALIPRFMNPYAKRIAIENASPLIDAIDMYKTETGHYPDSIDAVVPKFLKRIPNDGIHGIGGYFYEKLDDNYEVSFTQNVIMNFNFDVVIYNPKGEHKGEGEIPELHETGFVNWKYYLYD